MDNENLRPIDLAHPVKAIKLTVELWVGLFQDSIHYPYKDWSSTIRFLIVVAVVGIMSHCIRKWIFPLTSSEVPEHMARCRPCSIYKIGYEQIARRKLLARLIEAKTPIELWYDVKVLGMRDGIQSKAEVKWNKCPRWRGFKDLASDDAAMHMRRIFEMGRTSVLREMKKMLNDGEGGLDEWYEIVRMAHEEDMDVAAGKWRNRGTPPVYKPTSVEDREFSEIEERRQPPPYQEIHSASSSQE